MVVVRDVLRLFQQRRSTRVPFDQHRKVDREDLRRIVEAARWAPTAHNMQNFEIIVVDDEEELKKIGDIKSRVSIEFLRENYQQLSFSKEELVRRKVGILGTSFPPSWRNLAKLDEVAHKSAPRSLSQTINGSPVLLIVVYDSRKRAPASEGDVLGFMSLGCVMENMWLTAQSLRIGFHVLSVFGSNAVEKEVKRILEVPEYMKIAFAVRLGYPVSGPAKYLRVRRNIEDFTHHNRYGEKTY